MTKLTLASVCTFAFLLGSAVVGCGDDTSGTSGTSGSGGSATSSSSTGSEGGGGNGGSSATGGGNGGAGGGGDCTNCITTIQGGLDPAGLCESSKAPYAALQTCICMNCGAADGDPCFAACSGMGMPSDECNTCGMTAALGGACSNEGQACAADPGM